MPCYVDAPVHSFGRMKMCHLIADTPAELFDMVAAIGVPRKWFQPRSFPHFDICKSKRELAVAQGAIECDRREYCGHMQRIRKAESFSTETPRRGETGDRQDACPTLKTNH